MTGKITQKMLNGYLGKTLAKQVIVRDNELKGFGIRVSPKGKITFIVEARQKGVGGSSKRISLGSHPAFSLSQAREEARETLRILYAGGDPKAVKKKAIDTSVEAASYTLRSVFEEFLERRDLKPTTRKDYKQGLTFAYSEYLDLPIQSISRRDVEDVYWRLAKKSLSSAQRTSRILSSVMGYAKGIDLESGDRLITANPVEVLKDKGVKRTLARKDTVIPPDQLTAILDRLRAYIIGPLDDVKIRTNKSFLRAFYVLALTGSRKMEVFTLHKADVHLDSKIPYLQFNDTKNHQTHYVPITDSLLPIIEDAMKTKGVWLFPQKDTTLHISNPAKAVKEFLSVPEVETLGQLTISATSGKRRKGYSLHDLRRTFLTVGSEIGVDTMSLKKLVNHKSSDITEGYVIQRKDQRLRLTLGYFKAIQEEMLAHTFEDLSS